MNTIKDELDQISTLVNPHPHRDNTGAHFAFEAKRTTDLMVLIASTTDINVDDLLMLKSLCVKVPSFTSVFATVVLDLMQAANVGTLAWFAAQRVRQVLVNGGRVAYVTTDGSVTSTHALHAEDWASGVWQSQDAASPRTVALALIGKLNQEQADVNAQASKTAARVACAHAELLHAITCPLTSLSKPASTCVICDEKDRAKSL